MASDAFFPFPDALEVAADAGCSAVIHPGGSKGDEDVLAAAEGAAWRSSSPGPATSGTSSRRVLEREHQGSQQPVELAVLRLAQRREQRVLLFAGGFDRLHDCSWPFGVIVDEDAAAIGGGPFAGDQALRFEAVEPVRHRAGRQVELLGQVARRQLLLRCDAQLRSAWNSPANSVRTAPPLSRSCA